MTEARPAVARGVLYAFGAAVLWGATSPVIKRALGEDAAGRELETAALLYGAAAAGLALVRLLRPATTADPPLRRRDVGYLAGAVLVGGFLAPVLLVLGLTRTSGLVASLLLNVELPATAAIAVFVYGERMSPRAVVGATLVLAGGITMAIRPEQDGESTVIGMLAVAGACASWGFDNNLTARIAHLDPLRIAMIKGAGAAPLSFALSWAWHGRPPWESAWTGHSLSLVVVSGFLGYGLGLACMVRALRELGAARTGALFATAPFISALVTLPVLGERPTAAVAVAGALMALGAAALVRERAS